MKKEKLVVIKGAGDLASAIALRLYRSGFSVVMTDIAIPTAVRRTVSFSKSIYSTEHRCEVEGVVARHVNNLSDIVTTINNNEIAVLIDPKAEIVDEIKPMFLVDAILAKHNLGTKITDANLVIGIGPGFYATRDCDCVIETQRGHYLGRVIYSGSAAPNTGIPGTIGGYNVERIIRASADGIFEPVVDIKTYVKRGDIVAYVNTSTGNIPVTALIDGVVRGLLQKGVKVYKGMKSGDVDPRGKIEYCDTVSDKGSAIGGGVLEAICGYINRRKND